MFGTYDRPDGITHGNSPLDNIGIQYGLKALQAGVINAEEFTRLNEGVGSFTSDFEVGAARPRAVASPLALKTAYTAGHRQRRQAAREDRDHRPPRQPGGGRDPHELARLVGP